MILIATEMAIGLKFFSLEPLKRFFSATCYSSDIPQENNRLHQPAVLQQPA